MSTWKRLRCSLSFFTWRQISVKGFLKSFRNIYEHDLLRSWLNRIIFGQGLYRDTQFELQSRKITNFHEKLGKIPAKFTGLDISDKTYHLYDIYPPKAATISYFVLSKISGCHLLSHFAIFDLLSWICIFFFSARIDAMASAAISTPGVLPMFLNLDSSWTTLPGIRVSVSRLTQTSTGSTSW